MGHGFPTLQSSTRIFRPQTKKGSLSGTFRPGHSRPIEGHKSVGRNCSYASWTPPREIRREDRRFVWKGLEEERSGSLLLCVYLCPKESKVHLLIFFRRCCFGGSKLFTQRNRSGAKRAKRVYTRSWETHVNDRCTEEVGG